MTGCMLNTSLKKSNFSWHKPCSRVEDEYLTKNSAEFHAHLGFELVGTFHNCGYKFDRWYDMVWMEKIIGEPHAGQLAVKPYSEVKE